MFHIPLYLIATFFSAIYYLFYLPYDDSFIVQQLFKMLPMLFILLIAYKAYDQQRDDYSRFLLLGISSLAIGSMTLPLLIVSLLFFVLAQCFFIRSMMTLPLLKPSSWLLPPIVLCAAIIIGWVVGNIFKESLYMLGVIISLYIILTLSLLWTSFYTRKWLPICATFLFVMANLFFAINNFISPLPFLKYFMMPPYYCACILFSLSATKYFGFPNKVIE